MADADKHVQTVLTEDEYERFQRFAREAGLSLKEAGHQALVEWIERQHRPDPRDPAFTVLDGLDDAASGGEAADSSATTDAREGDDLVEGWRGDDAAFTLADDPSPET